MNRPRSFYFFIDLGDYRSRHLPEYVYEDSFARHSKVDVFNGRDPIARAYAAFGNGSYFEAVVYFNAAIEGDPQSGLLYLARGQARIAIGDYRLAYEDLIRGMELIPEWADVEFSVAEIYSNKQDLAEHIRKLEDWVQRYPRDFKAHFVLGYIYYFQQDYSLAKDELVYTLAWDEEHPQAKALVERIFEIQAEKEIAAMNSAPLEERAGDD